ncbi:hypothetical protein FRC11_002951 [Ceratobasidium sp. 423]|nr:hypothetical protein FRC11_002951 [Ceratobasidium sp. 423]
MDFSTDEGREKVRGWYQHQGSNTRFSLLEYRKVKEGRIKHEFIVVWLSSTTLCRFDRRPRDSERGYALLDEGAPAEDSAHVLSSFETEYNDLMQQTEVLLTIKFPEAEDLKFILAVCDGIQTHVKASAYNLMRYNCYFFSWMLVTVVARRSYNWENVALSTEGWDSILKTSLQSVFQTPTRLKTPISFQRVWTGVRFRFSGTVSRLYGRSRDIEPPTGTPNVEAFQDALQSRERLRQASEAAAKVLTLKDQPGSGPAGGSWETVWLNAWAGNLPKGQPTAKAKGPGGHKQTFRVGKKMPSVPEQHGQQCKEPSLAEICVSSQHSFRASAQASRFKAQLLAQETKMAREWGARSPRAMKEWKSAWDECDWLGSQYATTVTIVVLALLLQRLDDIDPEQLVFRGSASLKPPENNDGQNPGFCQLEDLPSLQEFIRGRMQNHFEMVDRFGFGSSREHHNGRGSYV